MDAGVVLGAIGAVVGLGSLAFTIYAWRVEREARKAEIAIERERFDVELAERDRLRRADITATQLPSKHHRESSKKTYRFQLRNMGPSYSKHVTAYLGDDAGRPRSTRPFGEPLGVQEERIVELDLTGPFWAQGQQLYLMVEWNNDRGERQREQSNVEVHLDY